MRIVSCCVLLGACGVEPEHSFSFEVSLHDTQDVVGVSVDDELAHLEHRPTGSVIITRTYRDYSDARTQGLLTFVITLEDGSIVTSATRVEACLEECRSCPPVDDLTREAIAFGPPFAFEPGDRDCFFCESLTGLTASCP